MHLFVLGCGRTSGTLSLQMWIEPAWQDCLGQFKMFKIVTWRQCGKRSVLLTTLNKEPAVLCLFFLEKTWTDCQYLVLFLKCCYTDRVFEEEMIRETYPKKLLFFTFQFCLFQLDDRNHEWPVLQDILYVALHLSLFYTYRHLYVQCSVYIIYSVAGLLLMEEILLTSWSW